MAKKRLTKKRKLEVIRQAGGLLCDIAAAAGVHRETVRNWKNADPDIAAAIQEQRESIVDKAERALVDAVNAGDIAAAKYICSTLGRNRGYTTRNEIDANVTATANVTITIPHNGREPRPARIVPPRIEPPSKNQPNR